MKNASAADTRNFALIGHAHDGKTSLGEALLYRAGTNAKLGSVEEGSALLHFTPEEKERKSTLTSCVFSFDAAGHPVTLVDTPGDPNFAADGEIALHALDAAVLVVDAVGGAKVGTQRAWEHAKSLGLPVIAFVNGLDRERADFAAAVESLRKLGANAVAVSWPLTSGQTLTGVADLLQPRLFTVAGERELTPEQGPFLAGPRAKLLEAVAECDDALLEKYLAAGELEQAEIAGGLIAALREGRLVPVLCGCAKQALGVELVLNAILHWFPSPVERTPWRGLSPNGDGEIRVEPSDAGPFSALVLKTLIDRYTGTLSIFRVVSGHVRADTPLLNATRGGKERLGKLLLLRGAEHRDVPEAGPGDIVAAAKFKNVHTGDALCGEKDAVHLAEIPIPQGVIAYAVEAAEKGEEDKAFTALTRLVEEDPTLHLARDASTGEFLLTGMGDLHLRTTAQKLKRMFGVEVLLKTPKIPYRETLTKAVENVEGKLKKQSGGKGMYAVCYLSVEPLPMGAGFEFSNEIVGGAIPRNLIPAVEKGVREALAHGPLAGYPLVDLRVRCIDGKHHSVDSNEMAFKLAGSFGLKAAVEKAAPTLLEPVMDVEVHAPIDDVGDIMGDIASRRGRVQSSEARGDAHVIKAQVPMAEMLEYANALTSLTHGKGVFHMHFSHYEEVPAQIRDRIVAEAAARRAAQA